MKIIWSFPALEMLADLHEYIKKKSESAADKYIDGLYASVSKLQEHPESCAPCKIQKLKDQGYRCCLYKNHLIIYEIDDQKLNILAIIHSKRNPDNISV